MTPTTNTNQIIREVWSEAAIRSYRQIYEKRTVVRFYAQLV